MIKIIDKISKYSKSLLNNSYTSFNKVKILQNYESFTTKYLLINNNKNSYYTPKDIILKNRKNLN